MELLLVMKINVITDYGIRIRSIPVFYSYCKNYLQQTSNYLLVEMIYEIELELEDKLELKLEISCRIN